MDETYTARARSRRRRRRRTCRPACESARDTARPARPAARYTVGAIARYPVAALAQDGPRPPCGFGPACMRGAPAGRIRSPARAPLQNAS